jgi:hypothetical protein
MSKYTVQIEGSDDAQEIWQALHPAEAIEADSGEDAARMTAQNQNVAEGPNWRVLAWAGDTAGTSSTADFAYYPTS